MEVKVILVNQGLHFAAPLTPAMAEQVAEQVVWAELELLLKVVRGKSAL